MNKMGLNIDEILASLEQTKTAEEAFTEALNDDAKVEDTPEASVEDASDNNVEEATKEVESEEATKEVEAEEKTAETTEESTEESEEISEEDLQKVAQELDAQGRIMARAFIDELNTITAETVDAVAEDASTEDVEDVEEAEEVKEAEENLSPAENIIGTLYETYFDGE
jgi:hypothetical protein